MNRDLQFGLFVLLSCMLMTLSVYTFRPIHTIQATMLSVSSPVLYTLQSAGQWVRDVGSSVHSFLHVREMNQKLLHENAALKQAVVHLPILRAENQQLREQLSMQARFVGRPLAAQVLFDTSGPFAQSVMVSIAADDVSRGQTVVNELGLVGRVIEVFGSKARVLLLTDGSLRVPVKIADREAFALVGGNHDDLLKIVSFKGEEPTDIQEGDLVVTSGQAEVFDADIPVGVLVKKANVWHVRPLVDFGRLDIVTILRKNVKGIVPEEVL